MVSTKRAYIVLTHRYSLKKYTKDQWEVTEECSFLNKLPNSVLLQSSVILDAKAETVYKNRTEGNASYNEIAKYVAEKYPIQFGQFYSLLGKENPFAIKESNTASEETTESKISETESSEQ
ncbi:hypothetical protein RVBP16_1940 [Pseudomonas phage sp. 30-2]|nr:hypothetical protein Deiofobo_0091 [Pseudomonas phage Deifobo]BDR25754.1 hypothetical protein RVBP16_1940 [Pseudomonas phage sp. 30-2]